MKVDTMSVISTLKSLKTDEDPRVRHEADEALAALVPSGMAK
jgi:hypothetical protein